MSIQICMQSGCEVMAQYRGNCYRHYNHFKTEVAAKRTTWAKLEKAGKIKPCIRGRNGKLARV